MPKYDADLLSSARRLLSRRAGQRGRLPTARIRRSVSTAYYALFHFLIEEAALRLVGTSNDLRRRRRVLARLFSHKGIEDALARVRGATVDLTVVELLRPPASTGVVKSPPFAREIAAAFSDAKAKRHDADYDLNKSLSELDARILIARVRRAIAAWRGAKNRSR